jgi:hypothetical protein
MPLRSAPTITAIGDKGYQSLLSTVMAMDNQDRLRFIGELHTDLADKEGRYEGLRLAVTAPSVVVESLKKLTAVNKTICNRFLHDVQKQCLLPSIPEAKGKQKMVADVPQRTNLTKPHRSRAPSPVGIPQHTGYNKHHSARSTPQPAFNKPQRNSIPSSVNMPQRTPQYKQHSIHSTPQSAFDKSHWNRAPSPVNSHQHTPYDRPHSDHSTPKPASDKPPRKRNPMPAGMLYRSVHDRSKGHRGRTPSERSRQSVSDRPEPSKSEYSFNESEESVGQNGQKLLDMHEANVPEFVMPTTKSPPKDPRRHRHRRD